MTMFWGRNSLIQLVYQYFKNWQLDAEIYVDTYLKKIK